MENCEDAVAEGDSGDGMGRGDGGGHEIVVAHCERAGTDWEVWVRDPEVTWQVCGLLLANFERGVEHHDLVIRDREA
jgi:hypothetical protein